jgi:hypothetical protein
LYATPGAWELGAYKTPGICKFDPNAYLKLYKIAHPGMAVHKSNNFALAVTHKQRGASIDKQKSPAFLSGASVGGKAKAP